MTDIATAIVAVRKEQDGGQAQVSISREDINRITWHDDNPTNITNQQITDKQAELVIANAEAKAQKVTDKASGNQKLLDLGLTQDEVDALIK